MYGVLVRRPSKPEFAKCTASPCTSRSETKYCLTNSRVQVSRLNGWYSALVIMSSCFLLLTLSGCAASVVVNGAASGTLVASPNAVTFGDVSIGQTASNKVSLVNGSAAAVEITQINLTGDSFSVVGPSKLPVTVAAGGTYSLNVQFNPVAEGDATGQLTITDDSTSNHTASIGLQGKGSESGTAVLSSLSCSSASMTGSGTDACTVTLNGAAPSAGLTVSISSSNAAVTVPATVAVPANATSAGFAATVSSVSSDQAVTLTATAGTVSKGFTLNLNAAAGSNSGGATLSFSTSSVAFGNVQVSTAATQSVTLSSTGTAPVTINSASLTGAGFSLSGATFPATLNPGQVTTLTVHFDPIVTGAAAAQLSISSNSSTGAVAVITLSGTGTAVSAALSGISCSSGSMTGSGTDACTVTLTSAAASSGLNVNLSSSNASVTVPATVTVPANVTSVAFAATVASVGTAQSATLTANSRSVSKSFALQLNAAVPTLNINPTNIAFGNVQVNTAATQSVSLSSTGTAPVTINSPTLTGTGFSLSGASFPATLNPGQVTTLTLQFDPATVGTAAGQLSIGSNSSSGSSAVISLAGTGTAAPAALSTLSCGTSSITGSGTDACTVTLTSAAASGDLSVALWSSNTAVTVPATVTIPANATSAGFTATVSSVGTAQTVTLTATSGSISKDFALQLKPAVSTLSINATSVAFGNVQLNNAATQSVTLTSTGTAPVTINSATLSGTGFLLSGASFPATLNPGQTATLEVQFDPTAAGVATGQLVVSSNSSTSTTASIGLSGTGIVPVHVDVTPATVSIATGASQQFVASVTGTSNPAVTWTVSGSGCSGAACGTTSPTGFYTAPTALPSPGTFTLTATSESDPSKSGLAAITIVSPVRNTYFLAPAADGGNDSNSGLSTNAPWLSPNHSINCGDVIIASPSMAYSATNFYLGKWGTVTCPDSAGVAWLTCATFDGCKISTNSHQGMWVDASYWGVQGWEISTTGTSGNTCFFASPNYGSPVEIHHIIFANDIANGCQLGGFEIGAQGTESVDYVAFVGNIAYNAAQGSYGCDSGISIFQPVQSDSLPGTHIYVAGNLSWGNFNSDPCNGGVPTDGQGIMIDTPDGRQDNMPSPYAAQIVVDNNISIANGGPGFKVYNNDAGSQHAPIYSRYNTLWGNNSDADEPSSYCGESVVGEAHNVQQYLNIAATVAAKACDGYLAYAYLTWNGDSTDLVYNNVGWSATGTYSRSVASPGTQYGPNNLFGTNPSFANPSTPKAPNCGSYSSVPACMAKVIADFTPTNPAAKGYGYQIPSSTLVYDPLFPDWLCSVNLPAGLVSIGCKTGP